MKFHLVDLCSIRILSCISNSHASRKGLRSHTTKKHGTRSHRKADDDESQTVGADSLEYTINPGARINSSLLYTIDEKQIYRRRTVGDTADRYVCNANVKPACRVALNVSKPGGIARKVTGRREHTHGSQEEQYLKNQFVSAVKTDLMKSCGDSLVRPKDVFAKRLAMDSVGGSLANFDKILQSLSKYRAKRPVWIQCDHCDYKFRSEKRLISHMKDIH